LVLEVLEAFTELLMLLMAMIQFFLQQHLLVVVKVEVEQRTVLVLVLTAVMVVLEVAVLPFLE
jgi:hypothetical protein